MSEEGQGVDLWVDEDQNTSIKQSVCLQRNSSGLSAYIENCWASRSCLSRSINLLGISEICCREYVDEASLVVYVVPDFETDLTVLRSVHISTKHWLLQFCRLWLGHSNHQTMHPMEECITGVVPIPIVWMYQDVRRIKKCLHWEIRELWELRDRSVRGGCNSRCSSLMWSASTTAILSSIHHDDSKMQIRQTIESFKIIETYFSRLGVDSLFSLLLTRSSRSWRDSTTSNSGRGRQHAERNLS